ncbi:MAG: DUF6600 domain-containing protein [Thermoanaerobaculia bacterium]
MRKLALLALFTSIVAVPLHAAGRSQSYFSYDDGGTIVRQGEDAREIEARVNMPVYPGDEVTTSRRGRVEIRLSDGNVLGLDRSTSVLFHSILDSYEGESSETIAELHFGHVAVLRTSEGQEVLRIDTENASYIATDEATYAVDTDRGRDRVTVYAGAVEVRTPNRTTRVRAGDEAKVDSNGLYGLISDSRSPADDFEIWFNSRAERYGSGSSRYLDRSLAYADSDLADNGSWTYVSGFGAWAWRPNVAAGWRPYYYGSWNYGPGGCLTWVSYEPWGWVPYHYGRWAYDPLYGWVWLPGGGYAPAWVYWMYGPNYVGWAPSGWWDCYKPYYNWCYRPYAHVGRDFGFGFYGRVRIGDIDLRPWTFVNPNAIMSTRVDRAALTTDAIRDRLGRNGGGFATVSNNPARFTRNELKDPDTAVNVISRRGLGSGTGKEGTGSPSDMTPFFRRDPDLSSNVRDRITRGARPSSGTPGGGSGGVAPIGSGSVAPIGSGNVAPIGGGNVAPIGGGNVAPATGDRLGRGGNRGDVPADSGRIDRGRLGRGTEPATGDHPATTDRPTTTPPPPTSDWRNRAQRPSTPPSAGEAPPAPAPKPPDRSRPDESWRGRAVGRQPQPPSGTPPTTPAATPPADRDLSNRGSDVPRRVIDRIGGARVYPGDSGRGTPSAEPRSTPPPSRDTAPPRRESSPPPPPRAERPSSGERNSSPPPARHEAPSSRDNSDGGKVHRDH